MMTEPFQVVTVAPSAGQVRPTNDEVRERHGSDALFGQLLTLTAAATTPLPLLPDVRSAFSELSRAQGGRRFEGAQRNMVSRLETDSRVAGATRAAHEQAVGAQRLAPNGARAETADHASDTNSSDARAAQRRTSAPYERGLSQSPTDGQRAFAETRAVESRIEGRTGDSPIANQAFAKNAGAPARVTQSESVRGAQTAPVSPATTASPRPPHSAPVQSNTGAVRSVTAAPGVRTASGRPTPSAAHNSGDAASAARAKTGDNASRTFESSDKQVRAHKNGRPEPRAAAMIDRIARVVGARANGRATTAHVQLDPPELGRVRVGVRLQDETVQIRLATETREGRDSLQSHISELRAALERQGIRVQRIDLPVPINGESTDPQQAGVSYDAATPQGDFEDSHSQESGDSDPLEAASGEPERDVRDNGDAQLTTETNQRTAGLDVRA
jgi:flagellar hook-length control protein FliK